MGPTRRAGSTSMARRACGSARAGGFTLIEMLAVLAVLAVVAALAAPGMRAFAAGQKVKAMAYDMTADLLLARSEALKRNDSVSITASGANWASGWTVSAGAENISTRNVANESLSVLPTTVPTTINFDVNGRASAPLRMTIQADAAPGESARRCIELDPSGRARSLVGACS